MAKALYQQAARELYLHTIKTRKEIAEALDLDPKTLYLWIKKGKWDEMKAAAQQAPGIITQQLYNHITAINDSIADREGNCPTFQEVEMLRKLVLTTKHMQQMSLGTYIQAFQEFTSYVYNSSDDKELAITITNYADKYISGMAHKKNVHISRNVKTVTDNLKDIGEENEPWEEPTPDNVARLIANIHPPYQKPANNQQTTTTENDHQENHEIPKIMVQSGINREILPSSEQAHNPVKVNVEKGFTAYQQDKMPGRENFKNREFPTRHGRWTRNVARPSANER